MMQKCLDPYKWFLCLKQKFRSVFSSKSPESLNLDVLDARPTDIPPINTSFLAAQAKENSPSDGTTDHTGSESGE